MKKLNIIAILTILFVASISMTSCHRETCPAYRSVHTDKTFAYGPEGAKEPKNNKKAVEKKKREQLKRKKYKKPYSLFPGGVR